MVGHHDGMKALRVAVAEITLRAGEGDVRIGR